MVTATLQKRDYVVDTAREGRQALERASANPPDVIISDVMMPVMDGWTFVEQLRRDPRLSTIPVIFLTALGKDEARIAELGLRPEDFLAKPFRFDALEKRVAAALTKPAAAPPAAGGYPPQDPYAQPHPGAYGHQPPPQQPAPAQRYPTPPPGTFQSPGAYGVSPGAYSSHAPQQPVPQQPAPQQPAPHAPGYGPAVAQPQHGLGPHAPQPHAPQAPAPHPASSGSQPPGPAPAHPHGAEPPHTGFAPDFPARGPAPSEEREPLRAPPKTAEVSAVSGEPRRPRRTTALNGRLEQLQLSSLLVMMEMERKDGLLSLKDSRTGTIGRIFLRRGQVISAKLNESNMAGKESVYEMLSWKAGTFSFNAMEVEMEDTIQSSTTHLLMEGARLIDEANRDEGL